MVIVSRLKGYVFSLDSRRTDRQTLRDRQTPEGQTDRQTLRVRQALEDRGQTDSRRTDRL